MNNTLRVILKVLMVITWVLMMGWYISLLLTLLQAYRMYENMPIGEVLPIGNKQQAIGMVNSQN